VGGAQDNDGPLLAPAELAAVLPTAAVEESSVRHGDPHWRWRRHTVIRGTGGAGSNGGSLGNGGVGVATCVLVFEGPTYVYLSSGGGVAILGGGRWTAARGRGSANAEPTASNVSAQTASIPAATDRPSSAGDTATESADRGRGSNRQASASALERRLRDSRGRSAFRCIAHGACMSVPHEKALSHMAFSMYTAFCKRALQNTRRASVDREGFENPLFIGFFARPGRRDQGQGREAGLRPLPLCPLRCGSG